MFIFVEKVLTESYLLFIYIYSKLCKFSKINNLTNEFRKNEVFTEFLPL